MYLTEDIVQKEDSRKLNRLLRLSQLILVCKFGLEKNYWQRKATKCHVLDKFRHKLHHVFTLICSPQIHCM